jgi:hypothetical protein
LFDQCGRFFEDGSCLWRSKAFEMPEGADERHVEFELLP